MNYFVEDSFEYKDLPCCVVMSPEGYRCGYVGVHKDNLFWGRRCSDVQIGGNIRPDVHGGLTYSKDGSESDYPIKTSDEDIWWFGFDCDHIGDKRDKETFLKYFPECAEKEDLLYWDFDDGTVRTDEYVYDECTKLAEWFSVYTKKPNPKTLLGIKEKLKFLEWEIDNICTMDKGEICDELEEIIKGIRY